MKKFNLNIAIFYCVLSFVGGMLNTYSFLNLNHVFITMQSGNVLLMGMNVATNNWSEVVNYLMPIISFSLGVGLSQLVKDLLFRTENGNFKMMNMLIETLGTALVFAILPIAPNRYIACLLSFFTAFQFHSFDKMNGHSITTTMTTGNIKNLMQTLVNYFFTSKKDINKIVIIDGTLTIFSFLLGAICETILNNYVGKLSLIIVTVILMIETLIIFVNSKQI